MPSKLMALNTEWYCVLTSPKLFRVESAESGLQGFALKAVCPEQRSNEKRIKQAAGEEKTNTV